MLDSNKECLACEANYQPQTSLDKGTPEEYIETYCSPECYETFEQMLRDENEKTTAFNAHCDEALKQKPHFTLDNVQDIIRSFKVRVPVQEGE